MLALVGRTHRQEIFRPIPCVTANCACCRVFERCQEIGQECRRPEDIVIGEDRNGGLNRTEALDHLKTLVCFRGSKNLDVEEIETLAELSKAIHVLLRRDNNDGVGIASCNGQQGTAEIIVIPKGWNDHGDILGGEARRKDWADRFVSPSGEDIDNGAGVTPEPALWTMVSMAELRLICLGKLTRGKQTVSSTASPCLVKKGRGN